MSWPHILSFSRVVAGPVLAALVLQPPGDAYLLAALLFWLASITDMIDGKLARLSQRESPFGVFLDTTADKVMVSLTLVGLALGGLIAAWIPLVIIGREFLISGLRSYAASRNHIISAHIWGKGKTALTMLALFLLLVAADGRAHGTLGRIGTHGFWSNAGTASTWILALATVLTVVSGGRYLIDALPLFRADPDVPEIRTEERRRTAARRDARG